MMGNGLITFSMAVAFSTLRGSPRRLRSIVASATRVHISMAKNMVMEYSTLVMVESTMAILRIICNISGYYSVEKIN